MAQSIECWMADFHVKMEHDVRLELYKEPRKSFHGSHPPLQSAQMPQMLGCYEDPRQGQGGQKIGWLHNHGSEKPVCCPFDKCLQWISIDQLIKHQLEKIAELYLEGGWEANAQRNECLRTTTVVTNMTMSCMFRVEGWDLNDKVGAQMRPSRNLFSQPF